MLSGSFPSNGNTFINFGGKYPSQGFTGWIPKVSDLAGESVLYDLEEGKFQITGTIEPYKRKPEIDILSKDPLALE